MGRHSWWYIFMQKLRKDRGKWGKSAMSDLELDLKGALGGRSSFSVEKVWLVSFLIGYFSFTRTKKISICLWVFFSDEKTSSWQKSFELIWMSKKGALTGGTQVWPTSPPKHFSFLYNYMSRWCIALSLSLSKPSSWRHA